MTRQYPGEAGRTGTMPPRFLALSVLLILVLPVPCPSGETISVTLQGEVARPGRYELPSGSLLSDSILAAGGLTKKSWPFSAALVRESARREQEQELIKIREDLSARIVDDRSKEKERRFLARLRTLSPTGRIPVRVSHPRLLKNSPDDIVLEAGDTLLIPAVPSSVAVSGVVLHPGEYPHEEGSLGKAYLRKAGGAAPGADPQSAFVLRADGSAERLDRPAIEWNPSRFRWEINAFTKAPVPVRPGDTIVVPPRFDQVPGFEKIPGFHGILMRIAEIAGEAVLP